MTSVVHSLAGSRVSKVAVFVIVIALVAFGLGQGDSLALAAGGGQPVGGIGVGGSPLTPQQLRQVLAKEALVSPWMASGAAYSNNSKPGVTITRIKVNPDCLINPSDPGHCVTWDTISVGGQYQQEPSQENNWCGPGAATAVAMHWNSGWVNGYPATKVQADPSQGGYSFTLPSGASSWMGMLAQHYSVDGLSGVEPYPSQGAYAYVIRDALNNALGTGGYYITLGDGQSQPISSESSLFGNATYDIGHDGHPMIFLITASLLPEWPYSTSPINHFIEGYGYGYYSAGSSSSTDEIYYADSAAAVDQGTAGDYGMTYDAFWNGPWEGKNRNGTTQYSPRVIIV